MGLKLKLKANERVYLNGALLRNVGTGAVLELMNEVPMLREKDILLEQDAHTPCQKLYLIVQTLYFDQTTRDVLLQTFDALYSDIVSAAPSLAQSLKSVLGKVAAQRFYPALKDLQNVIQQEAQLIAHAKKSN